VPFCAFRGQSPHASLWISNARVIDPAADRDGVGDLFIRDGPLRRLALRRGEEAGEEARRARPGRVPRLVDIHVHFREPGQTHKETIATGSHCAAAGGFTTWCACPTPRRRDNAGTIQFINDASERGAVVRVIPPGASPSA